MAVAFPITQWEFANRKLIVASLHEGDIDLEVAFDNLFNTQATALMRKSNRYLSMD